MDKIKISGSDLRDLYQPAEKLSQVCQEIQNDLASRNQVICRIIVNAHILSEFEENVTLKGEQSVELKGEQSVELESEQSDMRLEEIETFEYWTDHKNRLAPQIIHSWKKVLPDLIKSCDDLAARIRFDGFQGEMPRVERLIENCQYLVESLILLRQTLGDTALAQYTQWTVAQAQMERLVNEAVVALERRNSQQLADVLEFELSSNMGEWIKFLEFAEKQVSVSLEL
jgi:hypothetical protein